MTREQGIFTPKTEETLYSQLEEAFSYAQNQLEEPLIPESFNNEDGIEQLLSADPEALSHQFAERMAIYRRIIQAQRSGIEIPEDERLYMATQLWLLNNLEDYINLHRETDTGTLYDEQVDVFESLRDTLESGIRHGYIKLPTGTGKTVLFTEFAEVTGLRTLVVTPTKILVDQTAETFAQFAEDIETGRVYSDAKEYDNHVTITTYNSFLKGVSEGSINPQDYELLILDEVHKSLTERRKAAVDEFSHAIQLGFTATPQYSQEKHVRNLLSHEIHSMSLREAVERGTLSSLSIYLAKTNVDLSQVKITRAGEYDDRDLERTVNIASRNYSAVAMYREMFAGQKAVAYCVSVQHASDLADMYLEEGISAAVVYGGQNHHEQKRILEMYKTGEISVICNADILIEGFDEPSASVCLNLRPTTSPVIAEQRAGRVLRLDPNNPHKHAYIVDFIDEVKDRNFFPVSLAQIVEGAHVYRKNAIQPDDYLPPGTGTPQYPFTQIEGLRVITDAEEIMRIVNDAIERKQLLVDEGWLTVKGLMHRFRMADTTVQKILEPYRETHPHLFRFVRNHQNRVYEHISPELVEIIAEIQVNSAPVEGWLNIPELAKEIGITQGILRKHLGRIRDGYDNAVRVYRSSNGRMSEHISPELASALTQMLTIKQQPEDWVTLAEGAELIGISIYTFRQYVIEYQNEFANDTCTAKIRSGKLAQCISPAFLYYIDEAHQQMQPPQGWITFDEIVNALSESRSKISRSLSKLKNDHPDLFGKYYSDENGRFKEHYSPELVMMMIDNFPKDLEVAPEGWLTFVEAADALGITRVTLKSKIEDLGPTARENVQEFTMHNYHPSKSVRKIAHHISPELFDLIQQNRNRIQEAPPGWMYNNILARELGISTTGLSYFVKQYRESHPDWFMIARGGEKGQALEHFSPEFVEIIRDHFRKD